MYFQCKNKKGILFARYISALIINLMGFFSLFFHSMQFWKFAITGCDDNQELKLWSCESWECLQTLTFSSPANLPSNFQADPCIRVALDLTANYMLCSDIRRKVYMLDSLAPGKFEGNLRHVIFKRILVIDGWGISCEIALIWMSLHINWWSVNIG